MSDYVLPFPASSVVRLLMSDRVSTSPTKSNKLWSRLTTSWTVRKHMATSDSLTASDKRLTTSDKRTKRPTASDYVWPRLTKSDNILQSDNIWQRLTLLPRSTNVWQRLTNSDSVRPRLIMSDRVLPSRTRSDILWPRLTKSWTVWKHMATSGSITASNKRLTTSDKLTQQPTAFENVCPLTMQNTELETILDQSFVLLLPTQNY